MGCAGDDDDAAVVVVVGVEGAALHSVDRALRRWKDGDSVDGG